MTASAPASVPPAADAPGPVRARWGQLLLALAAFVILPVLPTAFRSTIPIAESIVFVIVALATCAILGWWNGGSPILAAIWLAIAGWMLATPVSSNVATYTQLSRGWMLLIAAAFGAVSLLTPKQKFLSRALSAVGIAIVGAFMLAITVPDGVSNVRQIMVNEYSRRTEQTIAVFDQAAKTPAFQRAMERNGELVQVLNDSKADLRKFPQRMADVLPALLALETLMALALGWALFHRLSAVRAGPALGPIREFRFNDQLIWGLAVGATLYFLPTFEDGKGAGLNLLVFFGTLYLLRGVGVLSWITRGRGVAFGLILLTAVFPLIVGALAFGVGVGDTWMDWRKRVPSAT